MISGCKDVDDITQFFMNKAEKEKNHSKQQQNKKDDVLDRISSIADRATSMMGTSNFNENNNRFGGLFNFGNNNKKSSASNHNGYGNRNENNVTLLSFILKMQHKSDYEKVYSAYWHSGFGMNLKEVYDTLKNDNETTNEAIWKILVQTVDMIAKQLNK